MNQVQNVIQQMISITDEELNTFLGKSFVKTFPKNHLISKVDSIPNEIYFINKGIIRVFLTDNKGEEHTIHFALENQFIADYSNFILQKPAMYNLQTLEETQVVVFSRNTIDWGYNNITNGQKLGRLIAEYYFIYQDNRIKNLYLTTPIERYNSIKNIFPNIHNRVPQHMIASYLGITPIHLCRIKKSSSSKI